MRNKLFGIVAMAMLIGAGMASVIGVGAASAIGATAAQGINEPIATATAQNVVARDSGRADCPGQIACPLTGELVCLDHCPLAARTALAVTDAPACCVKPTGGEK